MAKTTAANRTYLGWLDLTKNELRNARLQNLGTPPADPVDGQFYWDTDGVAVAVFNGTDWVALATMDDVTAGGLSEALFQAKGDLLVGTADDEVGVLTAGANGQFLVADSGESTGLEWRLPVAADVSDLATVVKAYTLDEFGDAAGPVGMGSQKLTGLGDGTNPGDAVNLSQLLAIVEGKKWKDPVRAAVATNVTLATGVENGDAFGGVTLATGDAVALLNQTAPEESGIYTVNASGAPTRRTDASTGAELTRATVVVLEGTLAQKQYTQVNTVSNIATDAQSWALTGDSATYTADGTTIELNGNEFSVGVIGSANIGTNAVTATAMAAASVDLTTDTVTGALPIGNGGTGQTSAAAALAALGGIRKHAEDLNGGSSSEVVTHNLGTRDVVVQIYGQSTPWAETDFEVERTSTNTITIRAAATIPASTYRVVVTG